LFKTCLSTTKLTFSLYSYDLHLGFHRLQRVSSQTRRKLLNWCPLEFFSDSVHLKSFTIIIAEYIFTHSWKLFRCKHFHPLQPKCFLDKTKASCVLIIRAQFCIAEIFWSSLETAAFMKCQIEDRGQICLLHVAKLISAYLETQTLFSLTLIINRNIDKLF